MLAVITDDFTGASEIGGVALGKGLRTVIRTRDVGPEDADVLIIASNMRSLDSGEAAAKSALLTRELRELVPDMIFKKVDSILRGNIGAELRAQMQVEKKGRALLVPANPSRGRTIEKGRYYVGGKPIAETGFAGDYSASAVDSSVVRILRDRGERDAVCLSPGDSFSESGIYVGNAADTADLEHWAGRVDQRTVPAGAADFFSVVLNRFGSAAAAEHESGGLNGGSRILYVCGSNFPASRQASADARNHGVWVMSMPDSVYFRGSMDAGSIDEWSDQVRDALSEHRRVIVAAFQTPGNGCLDRRQISQVMATVARKAVSHGVVDDLMIEGGATAEAVMSALEAGTLYPAQSIAPGVTRMRLDGYSNLHVTMKPGSYPWPNEIWELNKKGAERHHG